ncbi:MAG TPA: hypothetical protein VMH81_38700 [Bryobacteraceae bacterium]|nr:hypothetical protein [Bryobacteraceae bacterium]
MLLKRTLSTTLALVALTAAGAFAQTSTSTSTTRSFDYPPVGLGSTETAQVNVLNRASASSSGTAASCTGTISFVNTSGTTIGTASPFTVGSGQIATATLPFSKAGATGVRTEFVAVVTLTVSSTSNAPCELVTSLETYDSTTGATHLHLDEGGGLYGGGPGPGGRN